MANGVDVLWEAPAPDPARARQLAGAVGLHPLIGQLLINRGITGPAEAAEFIRPGRPSGLPWRLPGVRAAAWRMLQAVRRGEPVVVYGDYDADGQTSTAILVRALRRLGAQVHHFIPHRLSQGYGLHQDVLLEMAERGVRLVVAVDCGLTAMKAVQEAARRGLDVVVVDHHEPGRRLPPAAAVVAAHRMAALPGGESMAAAGLAYHTARALLEFADRLTEADDAALVQLAAVGTVADVVPLTGENRAVVYEGLHQVRSRPLPGLAALARRASVEPSEVEAFHVAFILAPRLNAAGRVDDPAVGLSLLLAESDEEAQQAADRLEAANRTRQDMERRVLEEALAEAEAQLQASDPPVIVVAKEGWHPGVVGVVASRLVDRFARPAAVIAIEGEEARGSARSVPNLNLYEAMAACAPYFTRFGGHPMATGFSLAARDVSAFRAHLSEAISSRWSGPFVHRLELDAWVRLPDLSADLAHQFFLLEPHGEGNPRPVLACAGLELVEARPVGADGRHLRLVVRDPQTRAEATAIAFGRAAEWKDAVGAITSSGRRLDLAFTPRLGRFGEVELRAAHLRPAQELQGLPVFVWSRDGDAGAFPNAPTRAADMPAAGEVVAANRMGVQVEDRRGLADGSARALVEWLAAREGEGPGAQAGPIVVGVRDAASGVALCGAVWRAAPDFALHFAWAGGGDPVAGPDHLFSRGQVLVTWDPRVLYRVRPGGELVLWQLPFEPWRWGEACTGGGVRRIVLAFGEQDRREIEGRYLSAIPGVEELRQLYRLLAAQASVAGPALSYHLHDLASALGVLEPRLREHLSPALLDHALGVFEEIGVVGRDPETGRRVWKGAKMGVKLDLTRSSRYNELIRVRQFWQEALAGAFAGDAGRWWERWAAARERADTAS
ncbi:MAG: single-stranded-DNA-specific exonuclease RecJ [Bacillota bacterium]